MVISRQADDRIVDEDFETERVIVDLRNGHYFCLNESGSWLWERVLQAPLSVAALADRLAEKHGLPAEEIGPVIEKWASALHEAGLLQIEPDPAPAPPAPSENLPPAWPDPTVTVYGDLEHLLALDPIHEVHVEEGWPRERAEG
jgi:hypothetical protein